MVLIGLISSLMSSLTLSGFSLFLGAEFWKQIPPNEPYRVILGDVRDKLYNTRERARHLLTNGMSDIPDDTTFTDVEQVFPYIMYL